METERENKFDLTFEDAIKELEAIVAALEKGEVPLDSSIKLFKRGIELSDYCNEKLSEAQGVVRILNRSRSGELQESPFEVDNE